jgi:hypothetical protein
VEADDLRDVIVAAQAEEAQAAAKQADERAKQQEEEAQSFASGLEQGAGIHHESRRGYHEGRVSQSGLGTWISWKDQDPPCPTDQSKVHYTGCWSTARS